MKNFGFKHIAGKAILPAPVLAAPATASALTILARLDVGEDTILLGANGSSYSGPFIYQPGPSGGPLDIVGVGPTRPLLTSPTIGTVLSLEEGQVSGVDVLVGPGDCECRCALRSGRIGDRRRRRPGVGPLVVWRRHQGRRRSVSHAFPSQGAHLATAPAAGGAPTAAPAPPQQADRIARTGATRSATTTRIASTSAPPTRRGNEMSTATVTAPRPRLRDLPPESWAEALEAHFASGLPGFLGYELVAIEPGRIEATMELRDDLMMAAGDFIHAGTVVAFADSLTGWGCLASLPAGREGFTTQELKANLVAPARVPGTLTCVATLLHGGRTTQVWDATVRRADGRPIGHFRCTQYLLEAER
ncbi:MAG TPA: PaaI family thioesterase [Solirubrobacterales bacterium]|nr:PaaI family thioesterase [Solirubrobacterales bacterium]